MREKRRRRMSGGGNNNVVNRVFYATSYHPIQAGSIDGTDVAPHDNGVRRALLCYNAGLCKLSLSLSLSYVKLIALYVFWCFEDDPCGDSKAAGDPYCTLFVSRISHLTTEETLREVRVCVVVFVTLELIKMLVR